MALDITLRSLPAHCLVAVTGELDLANARAFGSFLSTELEDCRHDVVVDLRGLDFLDAAGIGALVGASVRPDGEPSRMSVLCDTPRFVRLFRLTGTVERLGVHGFAAEEPSPALV
jgi:anti-sigma B factor antagonist